MSSTLRTSGTRAPQSTTVGPAAHGLGLGLIAALLLAAPGVLGQLGQGMLADGAVQQQALAAPGEVPEGLSAGDWSSIRAAYEAGRHQAVAVEGGHRAHNPGQQWSTFFDGRGFTTTPDAGGWTWGLELRRYGWGAAEFVAAAPAGVTADGQRVAYAWDGRLTEWYVNDRRGLEHGYTVHARPENAGGALTLELAIRGGLLPVISSDGRDVRFVDATGGTVLTYAGLAVFDADGRTLAAGWQAAGPGLRLRIEDQAARYPLTIDPVAQQAYLKASNTGSADHFGSSVAVSGDTVVVGANLEDSAATGVDGDQSNNSAGSSGAAYVFVRNGTTWSQQAYLKASNTGANDAFGRSVSVSGDTVIVGASNEASSATGVDGDQSNNSLTGSGAAYVFVRDGMTWTQQAYLKASNTGGADHFGLAVAVVGDTVVVGAEDEDSAATGVDGDQSSNAATGAGAAYVFVRSGTTWTQQAYLKASNTGVDDHFGGAVAVSGDTVVVGAWQEESAATGVDGDQSSNAANNAGAAYVFVRSGTTWSQQAYLKASNTGSNDTFGAAVALSGDTVVVGAWQEDSAATGVDGDQSSNAAATAGAAYVFVRSGTTWSQQAYLKASNTGNGDLFGLAVAVSGDTVVVGAEGEDSAATGVDGDQSSNAALSAGAAYVFVRSGTTWNQQAYLKSSNTGSSDNFGTAVAVSGDTVVVGVEQEDSAATGVDGDQSSNAATDAGAAYLFDLAVDTTPPTISCPGDMLVEATSASGAVVTFTATASDDTDPIPDVVCAPPSGSTFALGITTVTCTATDDSGNESQCDFDVTVEDTTAPEITCPGDITAECAGPGGTVVTYSASATDAVDPSPAVVCAPPSGSSFAVGTTSVTCTATDDAGNSSQCTFDVTIEDTTSPLLSCSGDTTVECEGPGGTVVFFTPSASDGCDASPLVGCFPASGSTFPLGTTQVTCTATDDAGNVTQCFFDVTVEDTTPPDIDCPSDITVERTSAAGAVVNYTATATDICDPAPAVVCAPTSGSTFPLGTTSVTCTATDAEGNSSQCSFDVTVEDTTPPTITCPGDMLVEATSASGAEVSFSVTVNDTDPVPSLSCTPPSGSTFPLGATTVTCTATDDSGNESQCSFDVTVEDTTAPAITCADDVTVERTSRAGAVVTYTTTATDACDPAPLIVCAPTSGSTFSLGTTTVSCTATDASGNASGCSFDVTVEDTAPPVIACPDDIIDVAFEPEGLVVTFVVTASDVSDPLPDIVCAPPSGSLFPIGTTTVTCTATDASGNSDACSFDVIVVANPWTDLGGGTSGIAGPPLLTMSGPLWPLTTLTLDLVDGAPSELAILFLSFSSTPSPFLGGTLHTFPYDELVVLATDGAGEIHGSTLFPPGVLSGTELWFQVGIADGSVPIYGASLSNGVKGTVP